MDESPRLAIHLFLNTQLGIGVWLVGQRSLQPLLFVYIKSSQTGHGASIHTQLTAVCCVVCGVLTEARVVSHGDKDLATKQREKKHIEPTFIHSSLQEEEEERARLKGGGKGVHGCRFSLTTLRCRFPAVCVSNRDYIGY